MAKKEVKNFVDQVIAYLKGDEDKTIALKNARKAQAAVKGQISALESRLVDEEDNLVEATEAAEIAMYPKVAIGSGAEASRNYVDGLISSSEAVEDAEEAIDCTKETIKFLKAFLADHKF